MKKLSVSVLALSMAAAGASFAESASYQPEDQFSGFYFGGGVGAGVLITEFNQTDTVSNLTSKDSNYFGRAGFAGQVFAGYGQVFNDQFYVGGEVAYLYQGAKISGTDQFLDGSAVATTKFSATDKNNFTAVAHLGYLFNDHYLGYILAGGTYGKQKATLSSSSSGTIGKNFSSSPSKSKWGYVVGLGGLTPVCDNVLVGGEVEYANFGKVSTNFGGNITSANFTNSTWTMLARVAYKLDI